MTFFLPNTRNFLTCINGKLTVCVCCLLKLASYTLTFGSIPVKPNFSAVVELEPYEVKR